VTARALWLVVACCALVSCPDPGVVGIAEHEPCLDGCPPNEHCLDAMDMCVECEQNDDCTTSDRPYCNAFACVACPAGESCAPEPQPSCQDGGCPGPCLDGGSCERCEEDSDCDGPGEQQCEDGFCVLEEDES
jgi:hypothetical protein